MNNAQQPFTQLTVRFYCGQRRLGISWYRGFTVYGRCTFLAR